MEDIILLILFTYPGLAAEYIYSVLSKGKAFYSPIDKRFQIAIDFFLSALITVLCMIVLIPSSQARSLAELVSALQTTDLIWKYTLLSLGMSVVFGLLFFVIRLLVFLMSGRRNLKHGILAESIDEEVWARIMHDHNVHTTDDVLVIKRDGKIITAGSMYNVTMDFSKHKDFALSYSQAVIAELQKGDSSRIKLKIVEYYDAETNTLIEFWYAKEFLDELDRIARQQKK